MVSPILSLQTLKEYHYEQKHVDSIFKTFFFFFNRLNFLDLETFILEFIIGIELEQQAIH